MSDAQGALPQAGWYADPGGGPGQRWWDGTRWTDATQMRSPTGWTGGGAAAGPGVAAGSTAYASFGARLGAILLDGLIVTGAVVAVLLVAAGLSALFSALGLDVVGQILAVVVGLAAYASIFAYYILLEGGPYGQTIGKRVVGAKVVKAGGGQLGRGTSTGRFFARSLSSFFYLGYLWALWDPERRTWHDMIVNTRVVQADTSAPSVKALFRSALKGHTRGLT